MASCHQTLLIAVRLWQKRNSNDGERGARCRQSEFIDRRPRGSILTQEWQLFEEHAHFNREQIPERVVHAKGSAAYGTLRITNKITPISPAQVASYPRKFPSSRVQRNRLWYLRCAVLRSTVYSFVRRLQFIVKFLQGGL